MFNSDKYPIEVTAKLYFEIKNSDLYGGKGSVGFTCMTLEDFNNPETITNNALEGARRFIAAQHDVNEKDVKFITHAAYDRITKNNFAIKFETTKPNEFINHIMEERIASVTHKKQ